MNRFRYLGGGSVLAIALTLGAPAYAQGVDVDPDATTEVEEIVVTGSLIRGTPEDAALPVDVIGQEELEKQGSPSTLELLKALPVSNGVLGDTNQFDSRAQGSEGSGSVNLRGLGPQRTLVLFNGRRMPINPFGLAGAGVVDTNMIPSAAIGRIEVLKDGAAATYGSDAIGGVVNFITRKNVEGLELSGSYRFIEGSDGDYNASMLMGWGGDNASILFSLGYQHRSELSLRERDWALLPYTANPEGGWSAAGNPSSFISLSTGRRFRDPQCAALGGFAGFSGTPGASPLGITPVCYWNYTPFDNLVEDEDRIQIYGELNYDINDDTQLHIEGLYGYTEVPHWKTSPSYALLAGPNTVTQPLQAFSASLAGLYIVPGAATPVMPALNPTITAFVTANPNIVAYNSVLDPGAVGAFTTLPASTLLAAGAAVVATRPFAIGGNPMFGNGASQGERNFTLYRWSASLTGQLTDAIGYDVNLTYGEEKAFRNGFDTVVSRYQLALRGLGGEGCDRLTGTPGVGPCMFFNPFSTAVAENVITGQQNPAFVANQTNSAELARWFFQETNTTQTADLFVAEAVLNGKLPWTMPGGEQPAWALGAQYRKQTFQARYNDLTNRAKNPCVDTPITGNLVCANPTGPFAFLGVGSETDIEQDLYALFGEVYVPLTENLNATVAARYEDYGGATGSTFNPKLSVRWQVMDWLALRGSVGSTFRAPPPTALSSDFVTSLQGIAGVFRAVDIYGDPNLEPETAVTYSVGAILDTGGLTATIDYWNFDFEDPITSDPVGAIAKAIFPNGQALPNNCNDPALAPLVARFTFTGGVCNTTNIQRLRTNIVNGANVQTSGIDVLADYDFGDLGFAEFRIGTTFTYVIEYKTDATTVEGIVVAEPFDAVGQLNYQTTAYPLPQLKGSVYAELEREPHNLRWTIRYIDGYTDQREDPFKAGAYRLDDLTGTPFTVTAGKEIDAFITHDLAYRVFLPGNTTAVVAVENVFDEDPPFARLDLNYDPFTASGLGRTVKLNLTKQF